MGTKMVKFVFEKLFQRKSKTNSTKQYRLPSSVLHTKTHLMTNEFSSCVY